MINIEGETIPNSQDTLAKQAPLLQLSSNDLWRRMSAVVLGAPHIVNMLTRQLCSHGRRKHTGHKQHARDFKKNLVNKILNL